MSKGEKKAINFLLDRDKAKLLSAFAIKEDLTLIGFLEKLIDNYMKENKELTRSLIKAYELNIPFDESDGQTQEEKTLNAF